MNYDGERFIAAFDHAPSMEEINAIYRDTDNPSIRYDLDELDTIVREVVVFTQK